ncbi:MAG: RDD family protein [bacterium]|nr:RDD family protein [bacterium]
MAGVSRDRSLGDGVYFAPEDYIGLRRRVVIFLVDATVLLGVLFALAFFSLFLSEDYVDEESGKGLSWIWFACIWFYLTVIKASRLRTVGYWVTGARIITLRGTKPSVWRMTYRALLNFYSPLNLVYDLLWVGVDRDRQSLTDRFAGTCVVRKRAEPVGRAEIHYTYYTGMSFLYFYPCVVLPRETEELVEVEFASST